MEKMKLSSEVPEELASMLGEDKKKKRNPLSKKKKILISAVALVTAGSIVAGSIFLIRSKKSDNTQTVYREYTVARGDILEGQTESSVITLDRKTVDFPVNAEVLEIYVKSGSQVKKGDKLIKLSAEDIDDSLKEYEADLKSAQTTLESAKLNRKTELLKAQQELESSKQSGSQSDDALSVQLEQAEFDLQSKKDAVTKAQKEYNELVLQQSSFSSDKSALDSAESTVNSRQAQVDKWQEKQSDYNEINSKLTSINNKIKQIADVSDMAQAQATLTELKEEYDSLYEAYYNGSESTSVDGKTAKVKLSDLLKAEEKYNTLNSSMSTLETLLGKQKTYENQLAKFDLDSIEDNLSSAKKSLETAQEKYTDLQEDFRDEYGNITDSDAMDEAVSNAESALTKAQLDYEKQKTDYSKTVLSAQQSKKTTDTTASTAQKKYQLKVIELNETVQKAQDDYDDLAESLQEIKDAIENDGVMTAPCTGVVASVNVEVGDTVTVSSGGNSDAMGVSFSSSSSATLMSITDTSEVFVSVSISEEEILNVSLEQTASVSMSAFPNQTFDATVESISTEGSTMGAATVTYSVTVKFDNDSALDLYDGMSADVTLVTGGVTDVLYLSKKAVSTTNGTSTVLLKQENGEPLETQVTTGYTDGQNIEIVSGLKEGDVVMAESALNTASGSSAEKGKSNEDGMPSFEDGNMPDFGNGEQPDFGGNMPNMS